MSCVLQGEVVTLANKALQSLCSRGTNVLLEGRSQTVNYIRQVARSFLWQSLPRNDRRLCVWLFIIMVVGAQVAAPFRVGVEGSAGDRHASHGAGADGQSVAIVGRQP